MMLKDKCDSIKTELQIRGKPVLLRLDLQVGHGIGSTATQRYALSADIYSFLLWQMGKTTLNNELIIRHLGIQFRRDSVCYYFK